MLNTLLPRLNLTMPSPDEEALIRAVLQRETERMVDPAFLVARVIHAPEFAWDWRVLGPGYLDLVRPYMQEPSWASVLLLRALQALDAWKPCHEEALALVEFAYWGNLINDAFNFHPAFEEHRPPFQVCERLTQLRFAGQHLNKFPSYTLYTNHFGLDDAGLLRMHQWLAGVNCSMGLGRGTLLRWIGQRFQQVTADAYYQNCVHTLVLHFQMPMVMAGILAQCPDEVLDALKRAFGYFSVAAKLGLERRLLTGVAEDVVPGEAQGAHFPLALPGRALLETPDAFPSPPHANPTRLPAVCQALARDTRLPARLLDEERRMIGLTREALANTGPLAAIGENLLTLLEDAHACN